MGYLIDARRCHQRKLASSIAPASVSRAHSARSRQCRRRVRAGRCAATRRRRACDSRPSPCAAPARTARRSRARGEPGGTAAAAAFSPIRASGSGHLDVDVQAADEVALPEHAQLGHDAVIARLVGLALVAPAGGRVRPRRRRAGCRVRRRSRRGSGAGSPADPVPPRRPPSEARRPRPDLQLLALRVVEPAFHRRVKGLQPRLGCCRASGRRRGRIPPPRRTGRRGPSARLRLSPTLANAAFAGGFLLRTRSPWISARRALVSRNLVRAFAAASRRSATEAASGPGSDGPARPSMDRTRGLPVVQRAEMVLKIRERGREGRLASAGVLLGIERGEELGAIAQLLAGDPRPVQRLRIEAPEPAPARLQPAARPLQHPRREIARVLGRLRLSGPVAGLDPATRSRSSPRHSGLSRIASTAS